MQHVEIGNIALIKDKEPHIHWKPTMIEKIFKKRDGLNPFRTSSGKTNRLIAKLYTLEVTLPVDKTEQ